MTTKWYSVAMDSTLPPLQPTPVAPRRSRLPLMISLIVLVAIAVLLAWWLLPRGSKPGQTPEDLAAQQAAQAAFEESRAQQRLANLEGIHLLIAKYQQEHGSYPQQLADLANIKGYAPGVARMVSETKLDNGQPAYAYTPADGSYQLCANQVDAEPKCEGPK